MCRIARRNLSIWSTHNRLWGFYTLLLQEKKSLFFFLSFCFPETASFCCILNVFSSTTINVLVPFNFFSKKSRKTKNIFLKSFYIKTILQPFAFSGRILKLQCKSQSLKVEFSTPKLLQHFQELFHICRENLTFQPRQSTEITENRRSCFSLIILEYLTTSLKYLKKA